LLALPVMGETEIGDGCVRASQQEKQASGIVVYLMEELGDARLRTAQLKKYIQEALDLVEKSPERDRIFEIAGHLLHGIPDTAFKLDKALDAAAMAAARLDYEEIKQNLKPEKADELEDVLNDVRLNILKRRSNMESTVTAEHRSGKVAALLKLAFLMGQHESKSPPSKHVTSDDLQGFAEESCQVVAQKLQLLAGMIKRGSPNIEGLLGDIGGHLETGLWFYGQSLAEKPTGSMTAEQHRGTTMKSAKEAAAELVQLAEITEATGQVPLVRLAKLIRALEGPQARTASDVPKNAASFFRNVATAIQKEANPSRLRLANVLRKVFADGMQMDAGTMLAAIYAQANSREDVIKGFMSANPSMSKEDAEKAADMWEKHKDVVKDKHQ